jgi:putative restriction endonuclease
MTFVGLDDADVTVCEDPAMAAGSNWTYDETLVAFRLYCRTPFGKLHQSNPDIIALATRLGRTPSAVGMKACNFASLDPAQQARGIKGLPNRSHFEREVWDRFHADSEAVAADAEAAYERLTAADAPPEPELPTPPTGPTESMALVRVRRVQSFFRSAVFVSYDGRCALTGLSIRALLNASHIVPWSADAHRRADPRNGLCLNALHDRAFDRGLITFDAELRVVVSPTLSSMGGTGHLDSVLEGYAGRQLHLPVRFSPDPDALAFHREKVFQSGPPPE